ncbi:MAG: ABC transporter permease [Firmicutes bacterium]|nr:ABC transporter permease [Bacillota bacterium]
MAEFIAEYGSLLLQGTIDSIVMTALATLFAYVFGLPLGILVTITQEHSILPCKPVNVVLGWIVNIGRSIPFIILLVFLMPFTRALVGTATGVRGAIVPLVIAATPFVARIVETSLLEVEAGLIEVAHAVGATVKQIVFKVMLPEAKPSILVGVPLTFITLLGYSAMAGAVGAGGLGDIAIRYGYYRYQDIVMFATIVLIVIIVQIIQSGGMWFAKKNDKRIRK